MASILPSDELLSNDVAHRYWPDVFAEKVSGGRFKPYRYQRMMARRIAAAIYASTQTGKGGRLIINVPSRHGKSTQISHWLPVWFLDNWPGRSVILASYGQALATHWGRKVRNEFSKRPSGLGTKLTEVKLETTLSGDSQAVIAWNTPQEGGMVALGVDGPVMGKGGHLIIVDDPHKDWEEAHSFIVREKTIEWFTSTLFSRQEPGATIVVVQQRLHEEDLSGYLIEKHPDPWEVIRFPALAEAGDPLGRQVGEPLEPTRYTADALLNIRQGMDAAAWAAMFQQNPGAVGLGRLYANFTQAGNEDKGLTLRDSLPLHLSFDFNRNPGMHVELGQYDPAADLFTCVHEIHGPYLKLQPALEQAEKLIRELSSKFKWPALEIYGDATGTQERAETTLTCYQTIAAWVKATGWPCRFRVPAGNPPIRSRVDSFNTALRDAAGDVHYKVHPRCTRLLADLKYMKEDEQGLEDKRDSKLSHASSAEGYRVHYLRPVVKIVAKNAQVVFGN